MRSFLTVWIASTGYALFIWVTSGKFELFSLAFAIILAIAISTEQIVNAINANKDKK